MPSPLARELAALPERTPGHRLLDAPLADVIDALGALPEGARVALELASRVASDVPLRDFLASFALPEGAPLELPTAVQRELHDALLAALAPAPIDAPFDSLATAAAFAREHGVGHALEAPFSAITGPLPEPLALEASRWVRRVSDCFTVHDFARRQLGPAGLVLLRAAATVHLRDQAAQHAAFLDGLAARLHRPWIADTPLLQPLLDRLQAARRALALRLPPMAPGQLLARTLDEESATLIAQVRSVADRAFQLGAGATVRLQLDELPGPMTSCTCRAEACQHQASLIDLLADAIVADDPELSRPLEALLGTPRWQRELERLRESARTAELRLVFEVEGDDERWAITALREKRDRQGRWDGRGKVRASELAEAAWVTPQERRALSELESSTPFREGDGPLRALRELVGHGRVFFGRERATPAAIVTCTARLQGVQGLAGVTLVPFGGELPLDAGEVVAAAARGAQLLPVLSRGKNRIELVELTPAAIRAARLQAERPLAFPPEAAGALLTAIAEGLPLELPEALLGRERPAGDGVVLVLQAESDERVELTLLLRVRPAPEGAELLAGEGAPLAPGCVAGERCFVRRGLEAERARVAAVAAALGLRMASERAPGRFVLDDGEEALELLERLEAGLPPGCELRWVGPARRLSRKLEPGALKLVVRAKKDWFGLEGTAELDGATLELALLLDAAREGRRFVRLGPDSFAPIAERLREQLREVADRVHAGRNGVELPPAAAEAVVALAGEALQAPPPFHALLRRLRDAREIDPPLPRGLRATLRPYQREGFRWLSRLAAWGGGGVLADEMGLGKTVQTLALLLSRAAKGPQLVVAPTSVVGNWAQEAQRFTPSLRILELSSLPAAARADALAGAGKKTLVLATWGVLVREAELLAGHEFATAIFDEAHAAKNAGTQRAKAARTIRAACTFALTGTPVENHLGELHALFGLVVPGLLGSAEQFRERFAAPIEREHDPERRAALSRLLRPYLLRRRKQEVAPELPPRTELIVPIELSEPERRLYEEARLAAVAQLEALPEGIDPGERRFQLLAAITRLRLCACHPKLFAPQLELPASKLARLVELLSELREEGHRALVFSQFTRHLDLVEPALAAAGLRALRLDGSTPAEERPKLVRRFQAGEADLFLVSLKAGGTGLNLTSADYVLHLDPWWNPAVEDQATDRAHRIGQARPVTVLRLVATGTIEERIVALHAEKRELALQVLEGAEGAGSLDAAALAALIRGGEAIAPA